MKSLLLTAIIVLTSALSLAQEQSVKGRVTNDAGKPIPGVQIINRKGYDLCERTNEYGEFTLTAEVGTEFGLMKTGFEILWTQVKDSLVSVKFQLNRKVQEIAPVVITRKNQQEALDIFNINILSFQPLGERILTLKYGRSEGYMLGLDNYGEEGISYSLTMNKPKKLFFDCMSNPYIISRDSAYMYSLGDSSLIIQSVSSIEQFRQNIMPCVGSFDDKIVMHSYSRFNQTYDLTIYDSAGTHDIFTFFDRESYQAAWEAYAKLVGTSSSELLTGDGVTDEQLYQELRRKRQEVYGRYDRSGDFQRALSKQNQAMDAEQAKVFAQEGYTRPTPIGNMSYGKSHGSVRESEYMSDFLMHSTPVRLNTFRVGNFLAVVNFEYDSVTVLDKYGAKIVTNAMDNGSRVEQVVQDKATGHIYLYAREEGGHKVYGLNVFTGQTTFVKDFGMLKHADDIKIYDSYLYYRYSENNFYQVNRVPLPRLEYLN